MDLRVAGKMAHFVAIGCITMYFVVTLGISSQDGLILLEMKQGFDDPSDSLQSWNDKDDSPCNWKGITCDASANLVEEINLANTNIMGPFPSVVCRLRGLRKLSLANNYVNGSIPRDLSRCTQLEYLDLSQNLIVGSLPDFISELQRLKHLDFSGNNFSGSIPPGFGNLPELQVLNLVANLLNATIPPYLGNLSNLLELNLAYNRFSPGNLPTELGNLTRLQNLWLADCNLVGEIPDFVSNLLELRNLDLSTNNLFGSIPESIANLKSVVQIELYQNSLSGRIPAVLGKLKTLMRFDASMNNLDGNLPAGLGGLNLQSLNLYENNLVGEIPSEIGLFTNLQELKLFSNGFTGNLPDTLGRFSSLQTLDIANNQFTGKLPMDLCKKNNLKILSIFRNGFTGTLPESLGACNSLNRIRMGNNKFIGEVPNKFWGLPHVSLLELAANNFHGIIPAEIANARNLSQLDISGNKFSGSLPPEIGRLPNLSVIAAGNNLFSGTLPWSLVDLRQLGKLDLHNNQLSGELLPDIGSWRVLTELNLSKNRFSGSIPAKLGDLPVLTYLDLSENFLTGHIPEELGNLKLNIFNVSDNRLSGAVPLAFGNSLYAESLAGNPGLCSRYGVKGMRSCAEETKARAEHRSWLWVLRCLFALAGIILVVGLAWFYRRYRGFGRPEGKDTLDKSSWILTSFHRLGALCIPFNEIVAIKVLDLDKCNSSLDGIRREVQTMSLINHPNVLRAHCSFVEKHSLWVVMPYMLGGSCLHIMKSAYPDGLEEKIIATFLREVLKALEYLHSHGHIHRDVKAGNILVDASGAVKLADFGVSACMFDTGDRLRSRNTFVGTPCWMAPEVMEQLHGYDFKADIWSFGITALELAHGHAPFSKYPPMKVLLMTLQNAPPGLDYERDKKFSKSFKEMVAMCLVKDPKKRPSAEKALRHHFFKHACSKDFIARTVLDGLPPLGDRFRTLKLKELDRLAQKKMAYGEKEERSQSEYIRGISAWNFDLEDLKARAVLDDGEIPLVKTVDLEPIKGSEELMVVPSYFESPVMTHSLRVENTKGGGDHVMQVQPGTVLSPLPLQSVSGLNVGRGCVDVYEDDIIADSPTWKECIKTENSRLEATQTQQKEAIEYIKDERHDLEKEHKLMEDIHRASVPGRKGLRGPGVLEHVLAACRGGPGDVDRHLHHQRRTESDQKFSGSSISYGTRVIDSCLEPSKSSGTPDINTYKLEDKPKESVVQQKGRFKVTSEDVDLEEAQSPSAFMHRSSFAPSCNAPSVAISTILPPLHSILQRNFTQTDQIVNLMKYVYPGKTPSAHHLSSLSSKSPSLSVAENFTPEASSSRERELLQQVADLQSRVANLVDELQTLKTKNAQLERQLNAAFNRKEERIKRG